MAIILNLETSTSVCSVSVARDGNTLGYSESFDPKSHGKVLFPFIKSVLDAAGTSPDKLSAIAVSKGPGSYTGLRIGVSAAKGLAYSLNIPLISIDTLQIMAEDFLEKFKHLLLGSNLLLCPMIDARRLEVYYSIFTSKLDVFSRVKAEIIGANTFNHLLGKYFLHFFGDGSMKCSKLISHNNAFFYEGVIPTAKHMATLSYLKFTNKKFEDTAYFEPFYLKEFITTKAINKLN